MNETSIMASINDLLNVVLTFNIQGGGGGGGGPKVSLHTLALIAQSLSD